MPQKPTMPTPHMTTVDANNEITLSCLIDSPDVITNYEFIINKDVDYRNKKDVYTPIIPSYFIGFVNSNIKIYAETPDAINDYTVVIETSETSTVSSFEDLKLNGEIVKDKINNIIVKSKNENGHIHFSDAAFKNMNLNNVWVLSDIAAGCDNVFSGCTIVNLYINRKTNPEYSDSYNFGSAYFLNGATISNFITPTYYNFVWEPNGIGDTDRENINITKIIFTAKSDEIWGNYNSTKKYTYSFLRYTGVKEIEFLNSPTIIPDYAFCALGLVNVIGAHNVISVGERAFYGCDLSDFILRWENLETIGKRAFGGTKLSKICLNSNLISIASYAFSECYELSVVEIKGLNVKDEFTIDPSAFRNTDTFPEVDVYYQTYNEIVGAICSFDNNGIVIKSTNSFYAMDNYTAVPIYGGLNAQSYVRYTPDTGYFINDAEYSWKVILYNKDGESITSPVYYFTTAPTPSISVTNLDENIINIINNVDVEFLGEYSDSSISSVHIKRYKWTLSRYYDDFNTIEIDSSGDIWSSYITYKYCGFVPQNKYRLKLEVENTNAVTVVVEYDLLCAVDQINKDIEVECNILKNENAVVFESQINNAYNRYYVNRIDKFTGFSKHIGCFIGGGKLKDYTAASNSTYKYIVVELLEDGTLSYNEYDNIMPKWEKVSIISFDGGNSDKSPFPVHSENIWYFSLDVELSNFSLKSSMTNMDTLSCKYPKIVNGKTGYKTYDISCLLGNVCNADYLNDNIHTLQKLESFILSPLPKLIVDTKGHVLICSLSNLSYNYITQSISQQTTINFNAVEVDSSDFISVYGIEV